MILMFIILILLCIIVGVLAKIKENRNRKELIDYIKKHRKI